jgi:flagellar biosynthetic protein FliR
MFDSATIQLLSAKFVCGILIFIRVSALMATGPVFSNEAVQPTVKIFLSALLAALMTIAFGNDQPDIDVHLWVFAGLVIKEIIVGIAIGYTANMVFQAIRFAGGLLDLDIGFQTALIFDSSADVPTLIGELKYMIALMVFFGLNGHHFLIEAVFASIRALPVGEFAMTGNALTTIIRLITLVSIIALKIAAPVLSATFITNIGLALLSKAAPQLNVFALSMQMKVIVGLLALFFTIPLFVMIARGAMGTFQEETYKVIMTLNPARQSLPGATAP